MSTVDRPRWPSCHGLFGFVVFVGALLGVGTTLAAPDEPSFEKLVELNSAELFGGKLSLNAKEGRFTLQFPGEGLFEKGFACRSRPGLGIISEHGKANKDVGKLLIDKAEGKFSFLGFDSGSALSRFPLVGDFKISFKLRVRAITPRSKLVWFLNREGNSSFIAIDFFRSALVVHRGSRKQAEIASDPRFQAHPAVWFDRKSNGVPVEIIYRDGKLSVLVHEKALGKEKGKMAEVVILDEVTEPDQGRLALQFDNLSFLATDFRIEGKLPREWIEQELGRLREAGNLRTEEPRQEEEERGEEDKKGEPPAKKKKEKQGPDLDKPDPEADEDL